MVMWNLKPIKKQTFILSSVTEQQNIGKEQHIPFTLLRTLPDNNTSTSDYTKTVTSGAAIYDQACFPKTHTTQQMNPGRELCNKLNKSYATRLCFESLSQ